jgi:hypothetical protein
LVTTILNVIRCTWNVAYDATWINPDKPRALPLALAIVQPILSTWPFFVLLVLLFAMGVRKKDGLWSTGQPWAGNGVHVAYAPAGPGGAAPGAQQLQPQAYAQPQQMQQPVWRAVPASEVQQYQQYPQYQHQHPQYQTYQAAPQHLAGQPIVYAHPSQGNGAGEPKEADASHTATPVSHEQR